MQLSQVMFARGFVAATVSGIVLMAGVAQVQAAPQQPRENVTRAMLVGQVNELALIDRSNAKCGGRMNASAMRDARLKAVRVSVRAGAGSRRALANKLAQTYVAALERSERCTVGLPTAKPVRGGQRPAPPSRSEDLPERVGNVNPGVEGDTSDLWERPDGTNAVAAKAISVAFTRLGAPYVWATQGDNRFDCSGLTWWAMNKAGVTFPRSSTFQDWKSGIGPDWTRSTNHRALQPGDFVYLRRSPAGPQHVGMFIGDGKMIHASSGAGRVIVSDITRGYYRQHYVGHLRPPLT